MIPGSPGAGHIGYRLRLTNARRRLLRHRPSRRAAARPGGRTAADERHAAQPGQATAVRVDLKPGDAATADVRFSPDIPGGTEPNNGPCEPKASTLRLTIGGGP